MQILFRRDFKLDEQAVQRRYLVRYGGHPEIMLVYVEGINAYSDLVRRFEQLMDEVKFAFASGN